MQRCVETSQRITVTRLKPEETRSKPEVTRPKPEVTRPKPEVASKPMVLQDPLLRDYIQIHLFGHIADPGDLC